MKTNIKKNFLKKINSNKREKKKVKGYCMLFKVNLSNKLLAISGFSASDINGSEYSIRFLYKFLKKRNDWICLKFML